MHVTDVVDAPSEHREAIESHAECEALIFQRVDTGVLQDIGVDHAGAHHFDPFVFEFRRPLLPDESHIHFKTRLDEWEETGTEAYFHVRAFEELFEKALERALQMRGRDIFADRKSFHLEEFRLMRHVGRFVTKYISHSNHAIWRLIPFLNLALHVADLHVAGVRSQHHPGLILKEERILHVARRVVFRDVQSIEIVPFVFHQGSLGEGKTHPIEDGVGLADEARDRVNMPSLHTRQYSLSLLLDQLTYAPADPGFSFQPNLT